MPRSSAAPMSATTAALPAPGPAGAGDGGPPTGGPDENVNVDGSGRGVLLWVGAAVADAEADGGTLD